MSEITDLALLILLVAAGFSLAALSTRLTDRLPVPAPALFLIAAAIISDLWPGLYERASIRTVERVVVVALIVILFNGGLNIGMRRLRAAVVPVLSLGLAGTFLTAGALAAIAHWALGMDWTLAGLVGAALAPTDPAVMFSILGRREIAGRSGTTLEGEAGMNDPAGIALMIGMIELATHHDATLLVVGEEFVVEMAVGAAFGLAGGRLLAPVLRNARLPSEAMYPILAVSLAAALYGATSIAHGSGFLAVFLAGLWLADERLPFKAEIERFHASLSELAELTAFIALGVTVNLAAISGRDWAQGLALVLAMTMVIRPLVVGVTLPWVRMPVREKAFIAFSGLKGAVPVLLAAFAIIGGVSDAGRVYNLVFVAVLLSVAVQGSFVPLVAQRLAIPMRLKDRLPWELSIRVGREPTGAHEHRVAAGSIADGRSIADLPLEADAWVTLVVRDGEAIAPEDDLVLRPDDRLLVLGSRPGRITELCRSTHAA